MTDPRRKTAKPRAKEVSPVVRQVPGAQIISVREPMPRQDKQTHLSKRDIELIITVVDCAWRNDWPVAQVVEHRLTQNWTALSMCLEDGDADAFRMIAAETRRLRRLQRRFASWRVADSAKHWRPDAQRHAVGRS